VLGGVNGKLLSQTSLSARVSVSELKIAPTFLAHVTFNWAHPGVGLKPFVLKNTPLDENLLAPVFFPHRGIWNCDTATITFSDPFKILCLTRQVPLNTSITICPSGPESDLREVISSASRPGDVSQSTIEKSGDLFEMKQYDPALGVRTILWRVFAKRGELMSRAPEAAVTPEGFTACFALIAAEEDSLATKIIDYAARLQSSGVSVAFNCSGNRGEPVIDASKVEEVLITSVWNPPSDNQAELSKLLETSRSFGEVTQVVLLLSVRSISEKFLDKFNAALTFLEMNQIKPIIAIYIPQTHSFDVSSRLISLITSKNHQILEL
jgi:hypothetical protein